MSVRERVERSEHVAGSTSALTKHLRSTHKHSQSTHKPDDAHNPGTVASRRANLTEKRVALSTQNPSG